MGGPGSGRKAGSGGGVRNKKTNTTSFQKKRKPVGDANSDSGKFKKLISERKAKGAK